jgi:hypothetical protein
MNYAMRKHISSNTLYLQHKAKSVTKAVHKTVFKEERSGDVVFIQFEEG